MSNHSIHLEFVVVVVAPAVDQLDLGLVAVVAEHIGWDFVDIVQQQQQDLVAVQTVDAGVE